VDDERAPWLERKAVTWLAALGLCFLALVGRLATLELVQGAHYASLALGQRIRILKVAAPRGQILDTHGVVLATDRPSATAELVYTPSPLSADEVALLSRILNIPPAVIEKADQQRRQQPAYEPVRLKTDLSPVEHTLLEEYRTQLPGVVVVEEPMRSYPGLPGVPDPGPTLAAHVLGYVQIGNDPLDVTGAYGIERSFNGPLTVDGRSLLGLAGVDGSQEVEVDFRGRPERVLAEQAPVPGNNVVLTIDAQLQAVAQRALAVRMEQLRTRNDFGYPDPGPFPTAYAGGVVVIDPRSGAVLALASEPAFDPNAFAQAAHVLPGTPAWQQWQQTWAYLSSPKTPGLPLIDHAISDLFPPGSTFKPLTALAALKAGVITPQEKIPCPGAYEVAPGYYKHDWVPTGQGILNLFQAIGVSCDTYFYKVGAATGIDAIDAMARQFMLGQPTGQTALAGENPGQVASPAVKAKLFPRQPWYAAETMDAAIGQGYTALNLLELADYAATLANGGTVYQPYFVREITSPTGQVLARFGPVVRGHVDLPASFFDVIHQAMATTTQYNPGWTADGVYSNYGTAAYLFSDFYAAEEKYLGHITPVAAKTGTSEVSGIADGQFICYAPADQPVIAVAVYVQHGGGGAVSGAPVCAAVLAQYFGVPESAAVPALAEAPAPAVAARPGTGTGG
jgi:penicillin-binding protein 2